jgi:2-oxoglutarate ferredoxin oxidoreductase subunit delta
VSRRILIQPRLCKGCEICVRMCPKRVLEMRDFVAAAARPDDCTACMLCEMRCPDFAIEVHGKTGGKKGMVTPR